MRLLVGEADLEVHVVEVGGQTEVGDLVVVKAMGEERQLVARDRDREADREVRGEMAEVEVEVGRGEAVGEGIVAEVGQQLVRGRGRGRPRGIRGGRRALG